MIKEEKRSALNKKMDSLGIKESDISEKFMLPSSKGGQKADKTNSAVRLTHIPTGISVTCRETRERETNRFLARRLLSEKIEEKLTGTSPRLKEIEKKKKQKKRRKRKAKNKFTAGARKPGCA